MELENFNISENTGFLPEKPSQILSGDFAEWENVVKKIPQLIACNGIRKAVNEELPEREFSNTTLTTDEQWQRAYVVTTFLAQAYLWEEDSDSTRPITLPKKLSDPWRATADHIGVPPVATYAALVLYNYSLRDPSKELASADNLQAALSFTGNSEEDWFFMVHALEEIAAAQGLGAITRAYKAMSCQDTRSLKECFEMITKTLQNMEKTLPLMYQKCTPDFFYNTLRPFLAFPERGVIYDEFSGVKHYRSGSGAQDSAIPAFSLFLDIKHKPGSEEEETLKDFEIYMPVKHREFLKAIRMEASVRSYVLESGDDELNKSYHKAVGALTSFRSEHIKLVTSYIINVREGEVGEEERGTGGTPFMRFLKNVRDNTK
jgi:indoleamine 2,3-dioxygenase